MRVNTKIWFIVALLITPWFWSFPVPRDLFAVDFVKDIKDAHTLTEWERGKIKPSPINRLFVNWVGKFVNKRLNVVMENVDIGNYFFSGHPRERVGVEEKQKFSIFQLILFLLGLFSPNLKKYARFLIIYSLSALLAVFIFQWRTFEQTVFLSIPFLVVIALGLERVYLFFKK